MTQPWLPLFVNLADRLVVATAGGADLLDAVNRAAAGGARLRLAGDSMDGLPDGVETASADAASLDGASLLLLGGGSEDTDQALASAAAERGVLTVHLDHSGATGSAVLAAGAGSPGLSVAVSTGARAPELESRLVADLHRGLPAENDDLAEILTGLRAKLEDRFPEAERREAIWQQVLDSPVLALLQAGDEDEAAELAERMAWGAG
ncbi:MAG: hypothetical protein AAF533_00475 [Acidobacteriota bacterium]